MPSLQVILCGGPPWGFRVSQNEDMKPLVGRVLLGGRADVEGIRIGDEIESVNGERVQTLTQAHQKIQGSSAQLRLTLKRFPGVAHSIIRQEHLSCSVDNSPICERKLLPPVFSVPSSPTLSRLQRESQVDRKPLHWRGGTADKKRFFEQNCPEPSRPITTDRLLERKIQMGGEKGVPSDGFSTCGYDSVGGDFAGRYSAQASDRLTPSTDNERFGMDCNVSTDEDDSKPFGFGPKDLDRIVEDQMSHLQYQQQSPQWGMKCEVNNAGNAMGAVEVPGRRSVAELTQHLAGRLEVKSPIGKPIRPHTPSSQMGRVVDNGSGRETPSQLSTIVRVHEQNGYPELERKPYLGRVLDGPPPADSYYQGVPPTSVVQGSPNTPPTVAAKKPSITQSFLNGVQNSSRSPSLSQNFRNGVHAGLSNNGFADPNYSPSFYRREMFNQNGNNGDYSRSETKTPVGFGNGNGANGFSDVQSSQKTPAGLPPRQETKTPVNMYTPGLFRPDNKTPTPSQSQVSSIHGQSPTPSSSYGSATPNSHHYTTPPSNFNGNYTNEGMTSPFDERAFASGGGRDGERRVESSESTSEGTTTKTEVKPVPNSPTKTTEASLPSEDGANGNTDGQLFDFNDTESVRSSATANSDITRCDPVVSRTHSAPRMELARMTPVIFDRIPEEEAQASARRPSTTMDLESSDKGSSFNLYSTQNNDHYGTIRRGKASLVSPPETPAGKVSYTLSNCTNDSGFDESQFKSPSFQDESTNENRSIDSRFGALSVTTASEDIHGGVNSVQSGLTSEDFNGTVSSTTPSEVDGIAEKRPWNEYDMSTWYKNMYKKMHKVDAPGDQSILKYYVRDGASPAPSVNRPYTPSGRLESASRPASRLDYDDHSASIQPRRAKSVGRTFENDGGPRSPNRYAWERHLTTHFHLPSFRFHGGPLSPSGLQGSGRGSGPSSPGGQPCLRMGRYCADKYPTNANLCSRCGWPRKDPTWEEIEALYAHLDKETTKKERNERIQTTSERCSITQKLDQTAAELELFIRQLDQCWKRSASSPVLSAWTTQKEVPSSNVGADLAELKRVSREEQMYRQKAERLTEELEAQRSRRHGYVPSSAPALQKNLDRFTGLINNYGRESPARTASPLPTGRRSVQPPVNVITCTAIYKFTAHSERELSLNKGDIVRIHRQIDGNWIEGERNGKIGIFPASYVQVESEFDRNPVKYRVVYPFTGRNSNEMSLKIGELVTFRREIDMNWMEGTNHIGEIGIFPSCYVRRLEDVEVVPDLAPARPKTPHVPQVRYEHERTPEAQDEATLCLPHPVPSNVHTNTQDLPYTGTTTMERNQYPTTNQYPQSNQYQSNSGSYPTENQYNGRYSQDQVDQYPSTNQYRTENQVPSANIYQPEEIQQQAPVQSKASAQADYDDDRSEHCEKVAVWQEKQKQNAYTGSAHLVPQNSETFRAVYAYTPCNEDELELQINDIVFVVEKCDDGWYIGTLLRTGQFGTFPGNYVIRH